MSTAFESFLHYYLTRESANTDLGDAVDSRIYAQRAPQGTALPYITFERISTEPTRAQPGDRGLDRVTYQFDIFAATHIDAADVADHLRDHLNDYRGAWFNSPTEDGSITVQRAILDNQFDDLEEPTDGTETPQHRVVQQYGIWYR